MSARRVIYTQDAAEQLIESHAAALDRRAVIAASAEAQRRLAANPRSAVDVLPEGLFAINVDPLRVTFEVHDPQRTVKIVAVRLLPGRAGWHRPGGTRGPA